MILYGELKQSRFDGEKRFILSFNVEKLADQAGMSVDDFIRETIEINPQFERVYTR